MTKPTRATKTVSTLIENIFTNDIEENNTSNGILNSDISDHLPQFYINNNNLNQTLFKDTFYYKKNITIENIMKFHINLDESKINERIRAKYRYGRLFVTGKLVICVF